MIWKRVAASAVVVTLMIGTGAAAQTPRAAATAPDAFHWLSEINKASAVMVTETGIVPRDLGKTIADSVAQVISDAEQNRALRSGDYLQVEPLIIAVGGPDVSRLHSGRSRQDIGATSRRLNQRMQILSTMDSLSKARESMLDFAAKNPDAVVPAYTWGVQAQPISFGHWVLGFTSALEREAGRMKSAYAVTNRSPLGAAALGTSSFPVDRPRLAQLLGFDGVIENSFDANQLAPIDTGAQIVGTAASTALVVGTFAADIEAQYRMSTPWLILSEGELTGVSSIMPQKRNPTILQAVRVAASQVMGDASTYYFKAHNVPAGMGDYKGLDPENSLRNLASMLDQLAAMTGALQFDPKRAAEEVAAEYSATTELADMLQRDGDVPFRVGHHFASEIVNFGRSRGLRPAQIRYADAQRIFAEAAAHYEIKNTRLPMDERTFQRAMTGENMVAASLGLGGPQPAEVARMLAAQRAGVAADKAWTADRRRALDEAARNRDAAFNRIRTGG
jgi:argininosuccinate lyase